MALNYEYAKSEDIHKIINTGTVSLSYVINTYDCEEKVLFKSGKIPVAGSITLPIHYIDSIYNIEIYDEDEKEEFNISQYNNLLQSIIYNVEEVVCGCEGCGCSDCTDGKECGLSLNTLISIFSYFFVINPNLNYYVSLIGEYLKCDIKTDILCYLTKQQITGKQDTQDLYYKIVGVYYAAFYYAEYSKALITKDIEFIKMKYKYQKISKCLKQVGVDLTDIEDIFKNYPVYYWQLSSPSETLQNVLPLLSDTYLDTKPVETMKVFTQGYTVKYLGIGRPVFVIKNAESLNYTINDFLGQDVTDQFDTHYSSSKKLAVFVAKEYTSFADLYFKFKQN